MSDIWIGIQDYQDSAPKWLDASVSFSWLRAVERIDADVTRIAYVREHNYSRDMATPIRGVYFRFRKEQFPVWAAQLIDLQPAMILYNLCEYNIAAEVIDLLSQELPCCVHVIRLHHEVNYLLSHVGFKACLYGCDVVIVPTSNQIEDIRRLGFSGQIHWIPFGVNSSLMASGSRDWNDRDVDFVCANTAAIQKNTPLLSDVFSRLSQTGYKVLNLGGLTPTALAANLGRSKVFFQPSMTEASGSRVLLDAIAAGCLPVAAKESITTSEVALQHGGAVVTTGVVYDFKSKTIHNPQGADEVVAAQLIDILSEFERSERCNKKVLLSNEYDEEQEILRLCSILSTCKGVKNRNDRPLARVARAVLATLGIKIDDATYSTLINQAQIELASDQWASSAEIASSIICNELEYPSAKWGLKTKIFREKFDFQKEVGFLIRSMFKKR